MTPDPTPDPPAASPLKALLNALAAQAGPGLALAAGKAMREVRDRLPDPNTHDAIELSWQVFQAVALMTEIMSGGRLGPPDVVSVAPAAAVLRWPVDRLVDGIRHLFPAADPDQSDLGGIELEVRPGGISSRTYTKDGRQMALGDRPPFPSYRRLLTRLRQEKDPRFEEIDRRITERATEALADPKASSLAAEILNPPPEAAVWE